MTETLNIAFIVAKPGSLRSSLHALLSTLPQIEVVAEANGLSTLCRIGSRIKPDLVLIEADLIRTGLQKEMRSLRNACPQAHCIVLVENEEQQHAAESSGANVVIFKGFRAAQLMKEIEALMA